MGIIRAVQVSLKYITEAKRRRLDALIEAYQSAVNKFICSLWITPGSLNKETLARVSNGRLSERHKSRAQKQALGIVSATRNTAKALHVVPSLPQYSGGIMLDAKFVSVEEGHGAFDLVVRVSGLAKYKRIVIPTRHTAMTRKWLARGTWIQGAEIVSNERMILWVQVDSAVEGPSTEKITLGIDLGINKLAVDSQGLAYGTEFKAILNKVRQRRPGSKGRQQASQERSNYINHALNQVPWTTLSAVGVENLRGLKHGKKGRSKALRKALAPWAYRRVLDRLGHKAQENRVRLVSVQAAYTSQTCPKCSTVSRLNRKGEEFLCIACGYKADADFVGAQNILARTLEILGSVESPRLKEA